MRFGSKKQNPEKKMLPGINFFYREKEVSQISMAMYSVMCSLKWNYWFSASLCTKVRWLSLTVWSGCILHIQWSFSTYISLRWKPRGEPELYNVFYIFCRLTRGQTTRRKAEVRSAPPGPLTINIREAEGFAKKIKSLELVEINGCN